MLLFLRNDEISEFFLEDWGVCVAWRWRSSILCWITEFPPKNYKKSGLELKVWAVRYKTRTFWIFTAPNLFLKIKVCLCITSLLFFFSFFWRDTLLIFGQTNLPSDSRDSQVLSIRRLLQIQLLSILQNLSTPLRIQKQITNLINLLLRNFIIPINIRQNITRSNQLTSVP